MAVRRLDIIRGITDLAIVWPILIRVQVDTISIYRQEVLPFTESRLTFLKVPPGKL
jgi:hypothetical protein